MQRAGSQSNLAGADPAVFNYIHSVYQDRQGSVRYGSSGEDAPVDTLALLGYPLIAAHDVVSDLNVRHRYGHVRRNSAYTTGRYDNYYIDLGHHIEPQMNVRLGLTDAINVRSGIGFKTPFTYKYVYHRYNTNGSYLRGTADYDMTRSFSIPLALEARPLERVHVVLGSDIALARQRVASQKDNNGTVTVYDDRQLDYANFKPTVRVQYVSDNSAPSPSPLDRAGEYMLPANQYALGLVCEKDITHLHKNGANGAQNLIDPYDAFMYPLDYFVAGSDASTFLTGNTSNLAAQVRQQNYARIEGSARYGVMDRLNVGGGIGYHSGSQLHHRLFNENLPRYYVFKPHYYFNMSLAWRLSDSIQLSVLAHVVPEYATYVRRGSDADRFKDVTSFMSLTGKVEILF
jgi:hypothetical protein